MSGVRVGRRVELSVEAADEADGPGGRRPAGGGAAVEPADGAVRGRGSTRPRRGGGRRMTVRIGVVLFPGSNRDIDAVNALRVAGAEPVILWHESVDLEGVARDPDPGRLRVRRLPPGRRDRAVLAGDAGGRGLRGPRRPGPRDLQRLPGARRGQARAGGAAPEPRAAVRVQAGHAARRAPRHAVHPRARGAGPLRIPVAHGEGCYFADDATLDRLEREGGSCGATPTPTARSPGPRTPGNPNGSLRGIAGRPERRRQRGRADAPPGDRRRGDPRLRRRPGDHPLAGRVSAAEWARDGRIAGVGAPAGRRAGGRADGAA